MSQGSRLQIVINVYQAITIWFYMFKAIGKSLYHTHFKNMGITLLLRTKNNYFMFKANK